MGRWMGRGMRVRRRRLNHLWPRRLNRLWRRLNRRLSRRLNRRWPQRTSGSTVARQPSAASEPVGRRAQISVGPRRDAAQLVLFARPPRRSPLLLLAILLTQNPPGTITGARHWRLEDGSGTDQEHVRRERPRQCAHGRCANPQHDERHEMVTNGRVFLADRARRRAAADGIQFSSRRRNRPYMVRARAARAPPPRWSPLPRAVNFSNVITFLIFGESSLLRINQRHHSLRTRLFLQK